MFLNTLKCQVTPIFSPGILATQATGYVVFVSSHYIVKEPLSQYASKAWPSSYILLVYYFCNTQRSNMEARSLMTRNRQVDGVSLLPELSAEAACTRVCLLWEEGPLVLRFSTPKGTDLKKGLEPFPLCSDELSGFSFKIGTKSSSNIRPT